MFLGVLFAYLCLSEARVVEGSSQDYGEYVAQAIKNVNDFAKVNKSQEAVLANYNLDTTKLKVKWASFHGFNIVFGDLSTLAQLREPDVELSELDYKTTYLYHTLLRLNNPYVNMEYNMTLFPHISSSGTIRVTPGKNSIDVVGTVVNDPYRFCEHNITSIEYDYGDLHYEVEPHDLPHFFVKPIIIALMDTNYRNMFDFDEKIRSFLEEYRYEKYLETISDLVCRGFNLKVSPF